jgi:phosphoribosyl 1,2-cyclic phosphate phosphodiesterase
MDMLICGTAATNAAPALFCICEQCRRARKRGGKDIRSRTAYMFGETVRIDFGPDSNLHHHRYGLQFERLRHLLITHTHNDHWSPVDLSHRRENRSVVDVNQPLNVYGNAHVDQKFGLINSPDWAKYRCVFHLLEAWKPIDLGEGLRATPVLARHAAPEMAVNFLVEHGGRSVLIAHDTGWYPDATWEFLSGRKINTVLLDCTGGVKPYKTEHLGNETLLQCRDELAKRGGLAADARVIATHFSHDCGMLHDELEAYFAPHGVTVAYDGMMVTL